MSNSEYNSDSDTEEEYEIKVNLCTGVERIENIDELRKHVLLRPGNYIGICALSEQNEWVLREGRMVHTTVNVNLGLLHCYYEPLSNIVDNIERSLEHGTVCDDIEIRIDKTSCYMKNNGYTIPFLKNEKTGLYDASLAFGVLMSGTNYKDEGKRTKSGRNGLGVKLTNIFSLEFIVKICNGKQLFTQKWTDNMEHTEGAIITDLKEEEEPYTELYWKPDFQRFGIIYFDDDHMSIFKRMVYDASMNGKVPITLNFFDIEVESLSDFAGLHLNADEKNESLTFCTPECTVVLAASKKPHVISFVNGVRTPRGGVHVEPWRKELFNSIINEIKLTRKKGKERDSMAKITIADIKKYFSLFIVARLPDPTWSSQSKEYLTSPKTTVAFKVKKISKIRDWDIFIDIENMIKRKEMLEYKKISKEVKSIKGIGLEHANLIKEHPEKCAFLLTEGDSAKTFALSGIDLGFSVNDREYVGRDYIGLATTGGKFLNVRNAVMKDIGKNSKVQAMINAIGLCPDKDYTLDKDFKTLNYGVVVLVTDSDTDGYHIEGLFINMIEFMFPSVLQRKDAFIVSMRTPILHLTLKNGEKKIFFNQNNYDRQIAELKPLIIDTEYSKGLGSLDDDQVREFFGRYMVVYRSTESTVKTVNDVFHKKRSDYRKTWIGDYNMNARPMLPELESKDDEIELETTYDEFLNHEFILHPIDNCGRSIPSFCGLKESQLMVLHTALSRKLFTKKKTTKVASFAGSVMEMCDYHHGDVNLHDTIRKMGQTFVGSNNLALFVEDGQFGSRSMGGKDGASARYIHTYLWDVTSKIFPIDDDSILPRKFNDGKPAEPVYYAPIYPHILANGPSGIGTGWACDFPCYNPLELFDSTRTWIKLRGNISIITEEEHVWFIPELYPWYHGFKGKITETDTGNYKSYGCFLINKNKTIEITELPIGVWTNDYLNIINKMKDLGKFRKIRNYSNKFKVKFIITPHPDFLPSHKSLKLESSITSNMNCYNHKGQMSSFTDPREIIDYTCKIRKKMYVKRHRHVLKIIDNKILKISEKIRFADMVRDKKIDPSQTKDELTPILTEYKFVHFDGASESEENIKSAGYKYLLDMPIRSIWKAGYELMIKRKDNFQKERDNYSSLTIWEIWTSELDALEKSYKSYKKCVEDRVKRLESKKVKT
jgi:DNA topoisomerase-2